MNLGELERWLAERNLGGHWNRHSDQPPENDARGAKDESKKK
jgi:hypothetical protein